MFQSLLLVFVIALSFAGQQVPDPTAQFNRAIALQQQGKLEEAAAEYRALLKLKPDYAEAHANLGVVLARLNRYDEAAASYETALRLNPKLTPILLNLGFQAIVGPGMVRWIQSWKGKRSGDRTP